MAAALARRAAATIPRHLAVAAAAATIPRHLAAAAPTISPAAAARYRFAGAFLRRRGHHTGASPQMEQRLAELEKRIGALEAGAAKESPRLEGAHPLLRQVEERVARLEGSHPQLRQLEDRVARLEIDYGNQTARLLVEIDSKVLTLELKMDKASFDRYTKLRDGQANLHVKYISVSDQIRALAVASAPRDVKADKQHVESLAQVKKSSWKVTWTVLFGASTVAFGVVNLMRAESGSENLKAAEKLFKSMTAELEKSFKGDLETTVKHAVNLALAHKALEASNAQDQPPPGSGGTGGGSSS